MSSRFNNSRIRIALFFLGIIILGLIFWFFKKDTSVDVKFTPLEIRTTPLKDSIG